MDGISFTLNERQVRVFAGPAGSPEIYLNSYSDDGETIRHLLESRAAPSHSLIVISNLNWNNDMTPWYCPPLSERDTPYNGKADDYLAWMKDELIPEVSRHLGQTAPYRAVAGYSLAGLFALYALYRTDLFSKAASISGSLWYPDLVPFVRGNEPLRKPSCVYFSLGDRESRSKNRYLCTVQDSTEAIFKEFQNWGIETTFQMNKGNHFQHPEGRTAKGLLWILTHGSNAASAVAGR